MDNKIKRINELYKKSQTVGLTEAEKAEQKRLREEYVKGIRKSVISQMNNISVEREDGTIENLADRGIKEWESRQARFVRRYARGEKPVVVIRAENTIKWNSGLKAAVFVHL